LQKKGHNQNGGPEKVCHEGEGLKEVGLWVVIPATEVEVAY